MSHEKSLIEKKIEEQRDLAVEALKNVESTLTDQQLKEANAFIAQLDDRLAEFYKPHAVLSVRGDHVVAQEMERLKKEKKIH